jgi:hypothetical protein
MPTDATSNYLSIDPARIRPLRRDVSVLRTRPTDAASGFLRETLTRAIPHARVAELGDQGAFGVYDDDRLVGFADPNTGQAHIVPLLETLEPTRSLTTVARAGGKELLDAQAHLFRDDLSTIGLARPSQLKGSRQGKRLGRSSTFSVLGTTKLTRSVDGLRVVGPGSTASASFSRSGIEGLTYRWAPVVDHDITVSAEAPEVVAEQLTEALKPIADQHRVELLDATPVYYDDGAGVMQPAYRCRLRLTPGPDSPAAPSNIVGYLPIGEQVGDLPPVLGREGEQPVEGEGHQTVRTRGGAVSIGRYVVRNDNAGWVASANSFWNALNLPFFGATVPVTNAQYYWAYPRLFTNEKDSFVNAVNFALTEVHGNWGLFTTLMNNADFVRLSDIPSSGYGGNGAGALAYWLIHSCEVIPTATDETTSFNVWWDIFNGLHAALGYRTEMWINDQVSTLFGLLASLGAPLVPTWLQTVVSDNDYQSGDTYFDGNRNLTEPMGRPSAVAVSGHGDDTLSMVSPLPRPSSLTEWWYDN